jgi:predicted ribosome quality control (RQC) complex YloA/Tae2 family protein
MKIIKAQKREEWKDRKLQQDEAYKFPSSKGISPAEENLADFEKKLKQNSKTFFGASIDIYNTSPAILEFVFDKLELDKKKDAKSASESEIKKLFASMKEIYTSKESPVFLNQGIIYSTEIGKEKEQKFESIQQALNNLLLTEGSKKQVLVKETPTKENPKLQKIQKDSLSMENKIKGFEISQKENQAKGEALFTNYSKVSELLRAVAKAKEKGLAEKEVMEKVNSIKPLIKELDFKKNKLVLILD